MFDSTGDPPLDRPVAGPSAATTALVRVVASLPGYAGAGLPDIERVEQIALLEQVKNAAAAAQARISLAFEASQRADAARQGVPARRRGEGIAEQVALARRESPHRARQHLGLAHALVEMPHTAAALSAGATTEWRATLLARETATLSAEHRAAVDEAVGARIADLGDREVAARAKQACYRLDPHALVHRIARTESDRTVSVRPAPDAMSYLTGLLPMAQGVACYATLRKHAESRRAAGDVRSLGQLMADTLIARVTGQDDEESRVAQPPVEVHVVMTDRTLFGRAEDPAQVFADGTTSESVPGWLARRIVREADRGWLRRVFRHPTSGELAGTDARRRFFSRVQRDFLVVRDQHCRTPWCGAPIVQADHVRPAAEGGPTTVENGAGLCARCNLAKQATGWRTFTEQALLAEGDHAGEHRVVVITPTGHTYRSRPPPPPHHDTGGLVSEIELYLSDVLIAPGASP